jgi:hypothetical protein
MPDSIPNRIDTDDQNNERGRPSINQQIEMEKKILPYFRNGISTTTTARELGLDVKTVRRYYKKFAKPKLSMMEEEFIEESKINVESSVCALDNLILEGRKSLEDLKNELGNKNINPKEKRDLRKELREIVKNIAHLITLKINLTNSPTADLSLNRMFRELMDKLV